MSIFRPSFPPSGPIVFGDDFIGRKTFLDYIKNLVNTVPGSGCRLSIIGEPRVGKSSLAYQATKGLQEDMLNRKILPVWVNLATFSTPACFFRFLVEETFAVIENLGIPVDPIQKAYALIPLLESEVMLSFGKIQRFFENVRKNGFSPLVIIDEFDHARNLFKGQISPFQQLRELAYRPEWRLSFIIISRRSIREIEEQSGAISTLATIFQQRHLALFADCEFKEILCRLSAIVGKDLETLTPYIERLCGKHPYFLTLFGNELISKVNGGVCPDHFSPEFLEEIYQQISTNIFDTYSQMTHLLEEGNRLNKLLELLFGPIQSLTNLDKEDFQKLGIIMPQNVNIEDAPFVPFSEHFGFFLRMISRDIDLWPLWSETEKSLRKCIASCLVSAYGDNWLAHLRKTAPKNTKDGKNFLDYCEAAQQREKKNFGSRASDDLFAYSYPGDLFQTIMREWCLFEKFLGKDKAYWNQRFEMLQKLRTPLAHNRIERIQEYQKDQMAAFAKELLSKISATGQ